MAGSGNTSSLAGWQPGGGGTSSGSPARLFRYAALQLTDGGVFVFFDNECEVPTMRENAEYHQFEPTAWQEAFGFALKRARVKISEIRAGKDGEKDTHLLFIRDPEDRIRPRTIHRW